MPALPNGDAQEEPVTPHPGPAQHGQAALHVPNLHQELQDPGLAEGPREAGPRLHQGGHRRAPGQAEAGQQDQEPQHQPSQGPRTASHSPGNTRKMSLTEQNFLKPYKQ